MSEKIKISNANASSTKHIILRYCDAAKVTRSQLADLLGMRYQTLSYKLNGKADFTVQELRVIIAYFNVGRDDIIEMMTLVLDETTRA